VRKILTRRGIAYGFAELYRMGRLDLSVEALLMWVLWRREYVQPWPHDELGRGFRYLVGDQKAGAVAAVGIEEVGSVLPFVSARSLGGAYRLAEHLLKAAGIDYAQWQKYHYNVRRVERGSWPLTFTCWTFRPIGDCPADVTLRSDRVGGTGWARLEHGGSA
jgi:hypothetical protein